MRSFIISRTSINRKDISPCEEAKKTTVIPFDCRNANSLEDAQAQNWWAKWALRGTNHREDGKGHVLCDLPPEQRWVVELDGIEELIRFIDKYGECILFKDEDIKGEPYSIEIYDDRL